MSSRPGSRSRPRRSSWVAAVTPRRLDDDVLRPVESFPTARVVGGVLRRRPPRPGRASSAVALTVARGIGDWGNNSPVGWAWDITNFVFWIGIGHAGTLICAILFLLRQRWRTAIARFAEAMTIFAVICALQFPLIHTGRPWLAAYWLLPLPNANGDLAELPLAPALGRVRGLHLRPRVAPVLVPRAPPRPRRRAGPGGARGAEARSTGSCRLGLAREPPGVEPLREGLPALRRPRHAARPLGPQRGVLRLRRVAWSPAGT